MPTYEYACTSCGDHMEVVQSFKDDPLEVCPACDGPLRKVFGSIGVVFKGSGFYKTDSRSSSSSSKAAETSETKSKETSKDSSAGSASKSDSSSSKSDSSSSSSSKTSTASAAAS